MKLNQLSLIFAALSLTTTLDLFVVAKGANALTIRSIALTDNNALVTFDPNNPTQSRTVGVTGLQAGETLLGIDFRPRDGVLYGLTNNNNVYTLNPRTGTIINLVSTLSVPFNGGQLSGIDFNPRPDRLRIVGSNNQNLRASVDDGLTANDTDVAYAGTDVNAGVDPNITAVAYTNSFAPSPDPNRQTQLFGIDSNLDILVLQDPPNDGTLNTIGSLGIDFGSTGGFDILSTGTGRNTAFAASGSLLYNINLTTGAATSLGAIGNGNINIVGLTSQTVPEPRTMGALIAFGTFSLLSRFRLQKSVKDKE